MQPSRVRTRNIGRRVSIFPPGSAESLYSERYPLLLAAPWESDAKPNCMKCWNTVTGARQTNYGTRIDYVLVDPGLMDESIVSCK